MKRCVRVNYAEYHIDILPAYPYARINNLNVKVPDKKLEDWKDSSPKGFAKWFEDRASYRKPVILLEKMAKVEPLPADLPYEYKEPLQRAVQIVKRYRDIYFKKNMDNAPISIVLTTLAGIHYDGETTAYEALVNIIASISKQIKETQGVLIVDNPSNKRERLSEKWDREPKLYEYFKRFISSFMVELINLHNANNIKEASEVLKRLLGESVSIEAFNEQAEYIRKSSATSALGITKNNGGLTIKNSNVPENKQVQPLRPHTFFGGR